MLYNFLLSNFETLAYFCTEEGNNMQLISLNLRMNYPEFKNIFINMKINLYFFLIETIFWFRSESSTKLNNISNNIFRTKSSLGSVSNLCI